MKQQIPFNTNDYIFVKLTSKGKELHYNYWRRLHNPMFDACNVYKTPEVDSEGWSKWKIWELIHIFGNNVYDPNSPFEKVIKFEKE